jgi:hypothetical protein
MKRHAWLSVGLSFLAMGAAAQQQKVGDPPEASNMKLLGWSDLQARSAYQPTVHRQGERWIAYIGHHGGTDDVPTPLNPMTGQPEPNGTSIIDVTDRPRRNTSATSPARPASTRMAARRWCGCATAASFPRATSPLSTCCAASAGRRTKSGTSPIRRSRS